MTVAGEVLVEVLPELSKFGSELGSKMRRAVDDGAAQSEGAFSRIRSRGSSVFRTVGVAAAAGFGIVASAAGIMGKASLDAYTESAGVQAQTIAGIKSTGGAAGITAKQVGALAESVRNYSGIDDEAIQSGENLLLTFTGIRNEAGKGNDIFNQSVKAMANLSARMGGDTKSAAIQLGKALNDPVKGVTALQRVGVSFTAAQKDQIAALVKSGDLMGAQKVVLGELTKEFGGSAAAMGAANPAAIMKSQMGDMLETLGGAIMPIMTKLLGVIQPVVAQLGPILAQFITSLGPMLTPIAQALGPVLGVVAQAMTQILVALSPLIPPLLRLVVALLPIITLTAQLAAFLIGILVPALNFFVGILTVVVRAVVGFLVHWRGTWDTVRSVALSVWNAIRGAASSVWNGIKGVIIGVWNGLKAAGTAVWNTIKTIILNPMQAVQRTLASLWNGLAGLASRAWNGVISVVRGAINALIMVVNAFIRAYNAIPILGNIGLLGHLAMGGPGEGLVRVGEHGPENVVLPPGSRVIGAGASRGAGGDGGVSIENFNVYGPADAAEVVREWNWSLIVGDLDAA